jgi:hypothetical protein
MICVSATIGIQLLTVEQQNYHLSRASDLLQSAEADESFFKSIVTGDDTWVNGYDPKLNDSRYTRKHLNHHNPRKYTIFHKFVISMFGCDFRILVINSICNEGTGYFVR